MGSWTMHIFCAAPGTVAASTSPGPATGDPGHLLSIPRRQQHPFYAPASERWCPALELQGRGLWQVHLPELEVAQGGGFNTKPAGHKAARCGRYFEYQSQHNSALLQSLLRESDPSTVCLPSAHSAVTGQSQPEAPGSHHPHVQLCALAASMHSSAHDIRVLWPAGITPTKPSVSQSIATACPGTAMPRWHATALDSPVLSLALPQGVAAWAVPSLPLPVWTLYCHHGRVALPVLAGHATSFPRGTQLCQARHGRLLVTPGWVSSEEHGDGEPAPGQRAPNSGASCSGLHFGQHWRGWGVGQGAMAFCTPLSQPGQSSFTPSFLPILFHPFRFLNPCPLLPTHLPFSSVVPKGPLGRAERLEQGTGLGDTAMM